MGSILFFVKSGERALEGAPQSRQSGLQEIVEDLDLLGQRSQVNNGLFWTPVKPEGTSFGELGQIIGSKSGDGESGGNQTFDANWWPTAGRSLLPMQAIKD
jgi:hypothetical protein